MIKIDERVRELVRLAEKARKESKTKKGSVLSFMACIDENFYFTNLEKTGSISIDCKEENFLVDIESLYKMLNLWKNNNNLFLTVKNDSVYIVNGNKEKKLSSSLDVGRYPEIDFPGAGELIDIPTNEYETYVRAIDYTSKDEARYFLTGVYFAENGDIVATEGKRLFLNERNQEKQFSFIMPVCKEWKKIDSFYYTKEKTIFQKDGVTVIVKNIVGVFPNYKRVIPKIFQYTTVFSDNSFLQEIKEVVKIQKAERDAAYKTLFNKNKIACVSGDNEYYTVNKRTFIDSDEGFYLNSNYIVDMINTLGKYIQVNHNYNNQAIVFNDTKDKIVIMPMS